MSQPTRHRPFGLSSLYGLAGPGLIAFALLAAGCSTTPHAIKTKADYADPYRTAEIHFARGYNAGWDHAKGFCEYHPHRGDRPGYAGDAWRHGYHLGVNRKPGLDQAAIHAWADQQTAPATTTPPETTASAPDPQDA
ncbi:MAG: hypothetical protein AAGE65_04570 [Planctomycetota bacterium]